MKRIVLLIILLEIASVFADETKWIAIGSLQSWYSSIGCEVEVGRRRLVSDQQDGLRWPAQYNFQDVEAAKALWIGTTDFDDPVAGKKIAYKVVHVGPRILNEKEFIPVDFKLIGKFDHPTVFVDGDPATNMAFNDIVTDIDPTIAADRILYTKVNTAIGITMTRKIYAYSQQNNDNYFIYDYIYRNTGIIDAQGTHVNKTLTDVMFFYQYRYAPTREIGPYGFSTAPQSTSWGHSTMNDARGEDPSAGDPFRAVFAWLGQHSKAGFDIIGGPNISGDGHLGAAQYVGAVVLHADKSPQDNSDDITQPTTTQYLGSDEQITSANDMYNTGQMNAEYVAMTAGHPSQTHAQAVGTGFADLFGGTPGGYSSTQGFGPYTLAPGDSIHIVIAEAVNGLSRAQGYKIGGNWLKGAAPYPMPEGGTTNSADDYKDAWVYTGQDSLFQSFNRAINTYQNGFIVSSPPPPPANFEVNSGGDRISLKWSNNAELDPNFKGYKVYRAQGKPDTTFSLIFSTGEGTPNPTIVNNYDDKNAQRGFDYFYYITSFDDGSNNLAHPGTPLESSKFFTITNKGAFLKRPAGENLSSIRVVPNPYNIRARNAQFGILDGKDKLLFVNLPPFCKIKIFTERGDLIQTLDHADGSGDQSWNSITSSRQTVVSGLYIAYIEVTQTYDDPESGVRLFTKGETKFVKFIIIR